MFLNRSFNVCASLTTGICVVGFCLVGPAIVRGQEAGESVNDQSYTRLTDPKIADAVKLTDEQRGKVAALITARSEAVAKAAPADRAQVIVASDKDLEAVLTEEQKVLFIKETAPPPLYFNFRFQKWSDVLEWYAKQAKLSLILDAPPPGTFNYSDPKGYTPVEAMDVLNGVLSTKGFTLIRRGGMLLVIDVQDGIPDGLIPRITPEELEKRGKFELVSVLFPLGGRDATAVKNEVTALLGPFGKSVLLPQTRQLLVTDSAGIVKAISAVIASMATPGSATPPQFAAYPLNKADAKVAEEVLIRMFPGAKIAADVKANQINAYATPAEQKAVAGVIEKMQAQDPPERKPRLEVYPVRDQDPTQLIANLTLVAPTARLTFNPRERQIAAFASPLDQENLKTALEKLGTAGPAETSRQMEVYRLSKADPSATMTLLQGLLPQTKISVDPQTRRLIVIASPDDHKAIQAILAQLQSVEPGPDTQTIQFYPLDRPLPASSLTALTSLVPKAQIVANPETKQLQVLASPADQAIIKISLEELLKGLPEQERRQMVTYPVTTSQRARFQAVLPSLATDFPDLRMMTDGEPTELSIWARPSQHALLKSLIDSLAAEVKDGVKPTLVSHSLGFSDPTTVMTVLKSLAPDARITLDSQNRSLVVIASGSVHEIIRTTIDKLQPGDLGRDALSLRFYPLEKAVPPTTLAAFQRLLPKVTMTIDADGKSMQVVANLGEHDRMKAILDEYQQGVPVSEKKKMAVYTVTSTQKSRFQSLLPTLTADLPDIRVVPDSEPNELAIWARPSQHELVKSLIESLANEAVDDSKTQLVSHPLRSADPTTTTTVLKSLVPEAKISIDSTNRSLVAIGTAEHQAVIKETLEKLQPSDLGPDTPVLRFYPLDQPLPPTVITALTRIAPKATITTDVDGKWVQVVATTLDHVAIKKNLDEQIKDLPPAEKRTLTVYTVTPAQRSRFQAVLPSLITDLPEIRVVADSGPNELAIWAKPTQHKILSGVLNELKREAPDGEKNQLIAYPLKYADPTTASTVLLTLFPGSKINVDLTTSRVLVWARPADHAAIKQAVDELDGEKLSEAQDKVTVYPVPDIDPDAAINLLQGMLPKVKFVKDTKARTIAAWAKKGDQETIAKALTSMRKSVDGDQKPRLKIYPAGKINAANMVEVLRTTFPTMKIAVDTKTGGLAAFGTVAEQEEVQSAIEQMMAQAIGETGRFVTYRIYKTERETAQSILKQAAPEASITTGKDPTQLLTWARPADHVIIKRIVDELESESAPNKGYELKVYGIKSAAATYLMPLLGKAVPKSIIHPSSDPNRLIIWAMPTDHVTIAEIVKQFDTEHAPESKVEFYDVQHVDVDAALRLAQSILQKQGGGSSATLIPGTSQLFVDARSEQQELVRAALKQLKPSESGFEAFQLEVVDAFAADQLIRRMFAGLRTTAPVVEADTTMQKLYVRGSTEQIARIREMLEKMGEPSATTSTKGSNRRVRVIPFGGDAAAALLEIQRIWPQLRTNELRVVPANESKSNLIVPRQEESSPLDPDLPLKRLPKKDAPPPNDKQPNKDSDDRSSSIGKPTVRKVAYEDGQPIVKPAKRAAPLPVQVALQQNPADGQPKDQLPPAGDPAPPVVVLPRDGSITILSDDTEALDQLDKLLRAVSLPTESGGRAFSVYSLKHAGATALAETIRQSLRIQSGSSVRTGAPTVVADERLNAIVVHASRNDRQAIERLIETLDTSEIPEALMATRPKRVAVKHGSAYQIEQVLRLVYKTQITTGGGRKEIPIPAGLPPEFAATLQQMNAANTGPILTLSVDDVSNSIVISAPKSLADQVTALIEELDQAALNENSQSMNLVPTQRMSSVRAKKILDQVLDKTRRGQPRRP